MVTPIVTEKSSIRFSSSSSYSHYKTITGSIINGKDGQSQDGQDGCFGHDHAIIVGSPSTRTTSIVRTTKPTRTGTSAGTSRTRNDTIVFLSDYKKDVVKRVLQLLIMHFIVYVSITVFYQCTNQIELSSFESIPGLVLNTNSNDAYDVTYNSNSNRNNSNDDDNELVTNTHNDCIYIPGGGFSGFWFQLGRLQSVMIHNNNNDFIEDNKLNINELKDERTPIICYSSGNLNPCRLLSYCCCCLY